MENLHIKIEVEGDSILVKYASDNSLKSIEDYPTSAYQPWRLGINTVEEFISWVTPYLTEDVKARDSQEANPVDLSLWEDTSITVEMEDFPEDAEALASFGTADVPHEVLL
jgi:hypothetical protein